MTLCKKITERLEKRENNYMNEMYNGDISDKKTNLESFYPGYDGIICRLLSYRGCCIFRSEWSSYIKKRF